MTSESAIRWVTSEADFERMRDDWNRLANQNSCHGIFLSHEWFSAAWQWRKLNAELRLLCVDDEHHLVGVLPLVLTRDDNQPRLEFLTIPDTQFCDVLLDRREPERALENLIAGLIQAPDDWHRIRLRGLPETSPLIASAPKIFSRHRIRYNLQHYDNNSFIMTDSWERFLGARSRRFKKGLNLARNHLHRSGKITIGKQAISDEKTSHILQHVSARSWKVRTGNTLDQPGPAGFLHTLLQRLPRQDIGIWTVTMNDQVIATELQLCDGALVYGLRADIDEAYTEQSPGTGLNETIIQHLCEGACERYYLGHGSNAYKQKWKDGDESLFRIDLYNRTVPGRLAHLRDRFLKPLARRILRPLRD